MGHQMEIRHQQQLHHVQLRPVLALNPSAQPYKGHLNTRSGSKEEVEEEGNQ